MTILDNTPISITPDGSTPGQVCLLQCMEAELCSDALLATRGASHTCILLGRVGTNVTEVAYDSANPTLNEPWQTMWNQLGAPPQNTLIYVAGKS